MRLFLALACLVLAGQGALAQPSYHRVTGVAFDDTLNVRAEPSASSADIGDIAHDATGIEVIGTDSTGKWGLIVWEEANGWIATRFLAPDPQPLIGPTELPQGLLCAGTEPFWSLRLSAGGATYSGVDGAPLTLNLTGALTPEGGGPFPAILSHGASTAATMAFIEPDACSDGMSSRQYPWRILFLLSTADGQRLQRGCCQFPLEAGLH